VHGVVSAQVQDSALALVELEYSNKVLFLLIFSFLWCLKYVELSLKPMGFMHIE